MTCTERQIRILIEYAKTHTQEIAAAKAGVSLSTAKRYLTMSGKPKRRPPTRDWRTRQDPFADVWEEVKDLLKKDAGLEAKTIMEWLVATYPDKFLDGQIRTLRRRIRDWRVLEGPESKEVFFRQTLEPGRQSQSDYTHCDALAVTIDGQPFPHMVYHFMLPYSRWEFVWICFTESYETLTTGYQRAVFELGAVAKEHRTDNLAAAVPIGEHHVFQKRWTDFLTHFGVQPSANNPGCSNENGSVEKSHDIFKNAVDQRLRMRGSRDFKSLENYDTFLQNMVRERNRSRKERLDEELKLLVQLPKGNWNEPKEYSASVTGWSTVSIDKAVYSVPSRFIGQKLKALVYYDVVKVYFGRHVVLEVARKESGEKCINYRHIIFHLLKKPGAFRHYQFREELFPRLVFRHAYDALCQHCDERADKEYLKILHEAAVGSESAVAAALQEILNLNRVPFHECVKRICERPRSAPNVTVFAPSLKEYDALLDSSLKKESQP
jgi:transposase